MTLNIHIRTKALIGLTAVLTQLLFPFVSFAQNNTNSPYTRFGYGELASALSGKNRDMGGTAIGSRERDGVNSINPASYTSIDSLTFIYEGGVMGKVSFFENQSGRKDHTFNGNLEFLCFRFPVGHYFAASAGITPFSYVGYDFPSSGSISVVSSGGGTNDVNYSQTFEGEGGINKVYLGVAGKIGRHLSAGVNAYYLFGDITHTRQITYDATYGSFYSTLQDSRLHVSDFNFTYGLQYYTPVGKQHYLSVGVTAELKNTLGGNYTIETSTIDTVEQKNKNNFETPLTVGLGVNYKWKNVLTAALDYRFEGWDDCKYFGKTDTLTNRHTIAAGLEWTPNAFSQNFLKRLSYRIGAYVSEGYLDIKGGGLNNYGITFGVGIPTRGGRSIINLGCEYGRLGNTSHQQIRESYWKINLSASMREIWFFKRQFE